MPSRPPGIPASVEQAIEQAVRDFSSTKPNLADGAAAIIRRHAETREQAGASNAEILMELDYLLWIFEEAVKRVGF